MTMEANATSIWEVEQFIPEIKPQKEANSPIPKPRTHLNEVATWIRMVSSVEAKGLAADKLYDWLLERSKEAQFKSVGEIDLSAGRTAISASEDLSTWTYRQFEVATQDTFWRAAAAISALGRSNPLSLSIHRLMELHAASLEEGIEVQRSALLKFTDFLLQHRTLRKPSIFITERGGVEAVWRGTSIQQYFSVEFLAQRQIQFVLFCPDEQNGCVVRLSGQHLVDTALQLAEEAGARKWLYQEE